MLLIGPRVAVGAALKVFFSFGSLFPLAFQLALKLFTGNSRLAAHGNVTSHSKLNLPASEDRTE